MNKTAHIATLWLTVVTASAAPYQEREALGRLISELQHVETVIREAEQFADTGARHQFRYDALRSDLEKMTTGVRDHLTQQTREPRALPPVSGNY